MKIGRMVCIVLIVTVGCRADGNVDSGAPSSLLQVADALLDSPGFSFVTEVDDGEHVGRGSGSYTPQRAALWDEREHRRVLAWFVEGDRIITEPTTWEGVPGAPGLDGSSPQTEDPPYYECVRFRDSSPRSFMKGVLRQVYEAEAVEEDGDGFRFSGSYEELEDVRTYEGRAEVREGRLHSHAYEVTDGTMTWQVSFAVTGHPGPLTPPSPAHSDGPPEASCD